MHYIQEENSFFIVLVVVYLSFLSFVIICNLFCMVYDLKSRVPPCVNGNRLVYLTRSRQGLNFNPVGCKRTKVVLFELKECHIVDLKGLSSAELTHSLLEVVYVHYWPD